MKILPKFLSRLVLKLFGDEPKSQPFKDLKLVKNWVVRKNDEQTIGFTISGYVTGSTRFNGAKRIKISKIKSVSDVGGDLVISALREIDTETPFDEHYKLESAAHQDLLEKVFEQEGSLVEKMKLFCRECWKEELYALFLGGEEYSEVEQEEVTRENVETMAKSYYDEEYCSPKDAYDTEMSYA